MLMQECQWLTLGFRSAPPHRLCVGVHNITIKLKK